MDFGFRTDEWPEKRTSCPRPELSSLSRSERGKMLSSRNSEWTSLASDRTLELNRISCSHQILAKFWGRLRKQTRSKGVFFRQRWDEIFQSRYSQSGGAMKRPPSERNRIGALFADGIMWKARWIKKYLPSRISKMDSPDQEKSNLSQERDNGKRPGSQRTGPRPPGSGRTLWIGLAIAAAILAMFSLSGQVTRWKFPTPSWCRLLRKGRP